MRILGLDVGSRRIGVAVTDELRLAAHPLVVLDRRGTARDVAQVADLARRHETTHVVAGIPFESDGSEGHRAARVRVLVDALRAAGLTVSECDESFSTVEAEEAMIAADVSRHRRKQVVDRAAAAVILGRWLDEQARAAERAARASLTLPDAPRAVTP